jgi:NAD(P)H-flavin reductase
MAEAHVAPVEHFERVRVLDAWDETAELRAVQIDLGLLQAVHRVPGQVIKARVPSGTGYFAIASAPPADGRAELLVKRGSAVADELIDAAHTGAEIEVTPPFGHGFPVELATGREVLLFAAGSGIAPIRALLQHLIARGQHMGKAVLFYGQRSEADFAYRHEHAAWERAGVRVVLCASQPSGAWRGARGYVQEVAREIRCGEIHPPNAVAYVSGMKTMIDGVRDELLAGGMPPERILLNF